MLLTLLLPSALAATLTVDASGGGDYNRIQSAVNNASNGDTITVAAGTYTESVDTKGKNLKITGAGSGTVTVDATGSAHSFTVNSGETVTIQGFTLVGGQGGMEIRGGATVTAKDVKVKNVTGESPGAGFLIVNATATVQNCNVKDVDVQNNAYGGGFFIEGSTATIKNCNVLRNTAYQGGGAYIVDSTVTMTDVTFDGNEVDWKGGGVRVRDNSKVTGTRVEVLNNSSGDQGAGFNIEDSNLTCTNCVVSGNSAGDAGGGVYISGARSAQGTVFKGANAEISGNSTTGAGGGFFAWDTNLEVRGVVADNTANSGSSGAAIYFGSGDLSLIDAEVSGHVSVNGGAVYVQGASNETLTVDGGSFEDNEATSDGGAIHSEAPTTIDGTSFDGNVAGRAGGAVFVTDASLTVSDSDFTSNTASVQGGGINTYKSALTAKRNSFVSNSAANGGGVYHHGAGVGSTKGTLNYNSFNSNTASGKGGGVAADQPSGWASTGNSYVSNTGEGAHLSAVSQPVMRSETYRGNSGHGLVLQSATGGRTEGGRFVNNGDAGLYATASKNHTVYTSVFAGNRGAGVVFNISSGTMRLENCDANDNDEGVVLEYGSGTEVVNVIAAYNTKGGFRAVSTTPDVRYSNAWENGTNWDNVDKGATGNLTVDPEYTGVSDDGNGNNDIVFLSSTSPCRDAGDPSILDADNSRSDMGSFGGPKASDEDSDGDGFKPSDGDCDEGDASVYPGAEDTWYDGVDSDCAGDDDYDKDGDGYRSEAKGGGDDCNDNNKKIHPGAEDEPGDGVDSDCDGQDGGSGGDSGDSGGDSGITTDDTGDQSWWTDADGDGFAPSQGDCDDESPAVFPGAEEICTDNIDGDCDGVTDEYDADCVESAQCEGCAGGPAAPALLLGLMGLLLSRRRR